MEHRRKERIELSDTLASAVSKMCDADARVFALCMQMYKASPVVDPDAVFEGLAPLLHLDSYGIYGGRIWLLYNDVCHSDMTKMLAVLRAVQLGQLSEHTVQHAIDNCGVGIDLEAVLASVREVLPRFGVEQPK